MNPPLRFRFPTPHSGAVVALLFAFGAHAPAAVGCSLTPPAARSPLYFLKAAKKLKQATKDDFDGSRPTSGSPAQAESSAPPPANTAQLSDLGWLAGRWVGKWGPRTAEQIWTAPEAGLMLGDFRLFEDDHTLLVELFTLEQKPDGLELRFRHFTPNLVPWEKSAATRLTLESHDSKNWVFLNSANGQPKRSIIIRVDPDTYTLRSEISAGEGPIRIVDITFHRQGTTTRKSRQK
jgi:Domain of unknown function (DUF6265)